jgi:hypothetical protein
MTMQKSVLFNLPIIILLASSCSVYNPQTADIPLINKKNDLRIDAGISSMVSAHTTISYGLTKKIAVQTFGSIGSNNTYYFQGAVGYFKALGNNKVMEIYTGMGHGYGYSYKDSNPGSLSGNYNLYFTQVNYGKIDGQFANMDYGFGLKMGYMHSSMTDRNYYDYYSDNGPFTTYNDENFALEPSAFLRLGGERLKFSVQLGSCWIYKFTNIDNHLPYSYINLGLGLNYRF